MYPEFEEFCEKTLFAKDGGQDYKAKIYTLPKEQRERFLYQEFVRAKHGERVRAWIEGRPGAELGYASAQISEIDPLMKPIITVSHRFRFGLRKPQPR